MLAEVCAAISQCLDSLQDRNSVTKIGFITYDSAVHFYNLNSNLTAAQVRATTALLLSSTSAACKSRPPIRFWSPVWFCSFEIDTRTRAGLLADDGGGRH